MSGLQNRNLLVVKSKNAEKSPSKIVYACFKKGFILFSNFTNQAKIQLLISSYFLSYPFEKSDRGGERV